MRDVIGSLTLIGDLERMAKLRDEALSEVVQKTTSEVGDTLKQALVFVNSSTGSVKRS